ncbi:MAG: sigma-70 family RNA polymerase sigma factor [Flavobacteriales bacterium]|jgi:RNA polymerase sigma-70 factor (ECF subfamily)|nr:sigma-70 family RNA polymerase sigma factor [Flavobacteriales bacterium]
MDSAPVQDDLHWIEGCKRGEKAAQKALFESLVPYLRGAVRRYIWDSDAAEDVLQEAFVRIFRNVERYDPEKGGVRTWAAKIAVNVALTEGKKRAKWERTGVDVERGSGPEVLENMAMDDLMVVLKTMPEDQYTVLNLHLIEGFNHEEIGEMLTISPELSRQRLARARKWVRQRFEPTGEAIAEKKEKRT